MRAKQHYAVLDGLRGLAAISVLLFHLGQWLGQPWRVANAGLAVDFFFCLSGYVLSVAYRHKLDTGMSGLDFIRLRVIRLMPLIVLGTLISAGYLAARIIILHDRSIVAVFDQLTLATAFGMVCVPLFDVSKAIGGPSIFPLNMPQYTLFFELIVNICWGYARRAGSVWFALGVMLVCYPLMHAFGMDGYQTDSFWTGFPRVFGAFYAGIVIFHWRDHIVRLPNAVWTIIFLGLLVAATITLYWLPPVSRPVEILCSAILSPLLVLSGSHIAVEGRSKAIALALGELSYPLYILHYPIFVWVNALYQLLLHRRDFNGLAMVIVPVTIITSWLILKAFDEPVRKWIDQAWRQRRMAVA